MKLISSIIIIVLKKALFCIFINNYNTVNSHPEKDQEFRRSFSYSHFLKINPEY